MEGTANQDENVPVTAVDSNLRETIKIDIKKNKLLGKGQFGAVFKCTFKGTEVAVKRLEILDCEEGGRTERMREGNAMTELIHSNVLRLIAEQEDDNFKYLILELCEGTIDDYIRGNYKGQMPAEIDGLIQMASGLEYIHSKRFVHRDIKPANVLISPTFDLKISDFGFCKTVTHSGSFSTSSGLKGTPTYMAPEYLKMKDKSEDEIKAIRACLSLDIFSLGCVFFSYIKKDIGSHLFQNPKAKDYFSITSNIANGNKFLKGEIPEDHYAYKLLDRMTDHNPKKRMGLDKVINALKLQQPKHPHEQE